MHEPRLQASSVQYRECECYLSSAASKVDFISSKNNQQRFTHGAHLSQVNDSSPTGTFLDKALFTKMAAKRKEGYKQKLVFWIRDCITSWDYENNVASVCLDSLVKRGILGKERKMAGIKTDYPTKNPGKSLLSKPWSWRILYFEIYVSTHKTSKVTVLEWCLNNVM